MVAVVFHSFVFNSGFSWVSPRNQWLPSVSWAFCYLVSTMEKILN